MTANAIVSSLLAMSLLSLLGACHADLSRPGARTDTTAGPASEQSRGEAVFRLQNAVMDQLIAAQVLDYGADDTAGRELAAYEEQLVDQCARLNEAANLSATGNTPSVMLKLRVMMSLPGCEQSALAASSLLARPRPFVSAALP